MHLNVQLDTVCKAKTLEYPYYQANMADEVPNNKNFNPEGDDFDEESYIEAEPGEQRDISVSTA